MLTLSTSEKLTGWLSSFMTKRGRPCPLTRLGFNFYVKEITFNFLKPEATAIDARAREHGNRVVFSSICQVMGNKYRVL